MAEFGNYKSYYRSRRNDTDQRLSYMRPDWFLGKKCIDIGCNEGVFTMKVAANYQPSFMIGIDLDPRLIDAAHASVKRAKLEANRRAAAALTVTASGMEIATSSSISPRFSSFLPRSLALSKATLMKTSPPKENTSRTTMFAAADLFAHSSGNSSGVPAPTIPGVFPENVGFVCKNAIDFLSSSPKYDVVMCLSVTKWIHLTEGDEGLLTLFRIIHQLTAPGGRAIIEYQAWRSYVKNQKTSAITQEVFKTLQIHPEDFETILTRDFGFRIEHRLGTPLSESKGFNRPILVLIKEPCLDDPRGMGSRGEPMMMTSSSSSSSAAAAALTRTAGSCAEMTWTTESAAHMMWTAPSSSSSAAAAEMTRTTESGADSYTSMMCEGDTEGESCSMTSSVNGTAPGQGLGLGLGSGQGLGQGLGVSSTSSSSSSSSSSYAPVSRKRQFGELHADADEKALIDDDNDDNDDEDNSNCSIKSVLIAGSGSGNGTNKHIRFGSPAASKRSKW